MAELELKKLFLTGFQLNIIFVISLIVCLLNILNVTSEFVCSLR